MALEIALEGESGATAEYWRVIEVNLNYFHGVGAIALAGYVSSATRAAGKRPLDARQFPIQGKDFLAFDPAELDKAGNNPVAAAYNFVRAYVPKEGKPANPFTNAKDV